MERTHRYIFKAKNLLLPVMLVTTMISCDINDARDICCMENSIHFLYHCRGKECFRERVHTIRYFLFDGSGAYIQEMIPQESSMQDVDIKSLTPGSYTIVAIANLYGCGSLSDCFRTGDIPSDLSRFRLTVDRYSAEYPSLFDNGDPLYWCEKTFTVTTTGNNYYTAELNNVHCRLTVKVEWERLPPYSDGFSFRLTDVGTHLRLTAEDCDSIGIHAYPTVSYSTAGMSRAVTFSNNSLLGHIYTLRWHREHIPKFRLWRNGTPASKEVDLEMLFRKWERKPWLDEEQLYEMTIRITADGALIVSYGIDSLVKDWQDGGTIG